MLFFNFKIKFKCLLLKYCGGFLIIINIILQKFLFENRKIINRDAGTFKVVSQMISLTAQKYYFNPIYLIHNVSSIVWGDILLFQFLFYSLLLLNIWEMCFSFNLSRHHILKLDVTVPSIISYRIHSWRVGKYFPFSLCI